MKLTILFLLIYNLNKIKFFILVLGTRIHIRTLLSNVICSKSSYNYLNTHDIINIPFHYNYTYEKECGRMVL